MAHRSTARRTQRKAKTALRWSQNEKAAPGAIRHGLKHDGDKAYSDAVRDPFLGSEGSRQTHL